MNGKWWERTPPKHHDSTKVSRGRLTAKQVRAIRHAFRNNWKQAEIARRFGISQSTVSEVVNHKTYFWVGEK